MIRFIGIQIIPVTVTQNLRVHGADESFRKPLSEFADDFWCVRGADHPHQEKTLQMLNVITGKLDVSFFG